MAKKPFINKHGFVEYPFLHDTRKQKNWWFYNLMEDHLKRRARQYAGPNYTREDCEEDFKKILASTNLKFYVVIPAHNEADFIGQTLQSLIGQTIYIKWIGIKTGIRLLVHRFE